MGGIFWSSQCHVLFQSPKYGRALGWFRCFWTRQRGGPLSPFTLSWQLVVWNDSFAHPNMVRQVNIYLPFPVVVTGCSGIIQPHGENRDREYHEFGNAREALIGVKKIQSGLKNQLCTHNSYFGVIFFLWNPLIFGYGGYISVHLYKLVGATL